MEALTLYRYKAVCTHVVDGDTVDLDVDLGFAIHFNLRVRLLGVNTPELHAKDPAVREAAQKARKRVEVLLLGELLAKPPALIIETKKDSQDKYGRYLARIYSPNGACVNDLLLAEGLAVLMAD